MTHSLLRILLALAVVTAGLLVPVSGGSPSAPASAADLRYFDPGNIISDAVFFDALSMDGAAVQRFLQSKGASCVAGEMPCLKDYREDTADQPADAMCAGYRGAQQESAATIIAKVGASCGVSPRVLLVLLQKEQSLVTRTKPTSYAYTKATGFGCPDTAPCNPAFSGFVAQVYFAARQFERYRIEAARYSYKAGRVNTILWSPNRDCGTSEVYIANQATAGLYNYTPYRPTQAVLDAGYGAVPSSSPDAKCAAYGNRNFWNYFTDWFGSTQSAGGSAILERHTAAGGAGGSLGPATTAIICGLVRGGCTQGFSAGAIYWSPATGARIVQGGFRDRWGGLGAENAGMGYPTTDAQCGLVGGGCFQAFEGGSFYSTTGTSPLVVVRGAIRSLWQSLGSEYSPLGYPVADESCGTSGALCTSTFERGLVVWSPRYGAAALYDVIAPRWQEMGRQTGLGLPLHSTVCGLLQGGCYQSFERGSLYWSPANGTHAVYGAIGERWRRQGAEWGPLGYPRQGETCLPRGGCRQDFVGGSVHWTDTGGARIVTGAILQQWLGMGAGDGVLGHPRTDTVCGIADGGCYQVFAGGHLYWSESTGAQPVRGGIREVWAAGGSEWGPLGYPTGAETYGLPGAGSAQTFQHGWIVWSPQTGALPVSGAIGQAWAAGGGASGSLGYPVEAARTTGEGAVQRFQGGTLTWSRSTGQVSRS